MRSIAALCLAAALLAPHPAAAQDAAPPPDEGLARIDEALSDPARQEQIAQTLRVLGEIVVDMPLAPLADAAAKIAGEDARDLPPGATLRSIAPEASRLPEQLERNAPRALAAMGSLAEALEKMMPALRDMARRLEEAAPPPR